MKLLTKNTDYAIQALLHLAQQPGEFVSSSQIAKTNYIPLMFIRRILQVLSGEGIVASREGISGGVKLAKKPKDIRIIDLMRLFQGEVGITECMFRKKFCHNTKRCALRRHLKRIEDKLIQELHPLTLNDLVVIKK